MSTQKMELNFTLQFQALVAWVKSLEEIVEKLKEQIHGKSNGGWVYICCDK
jgi:hypothetical protein